MGGNEQLPDLGPKDGSIGVGAWQLPERQCALPALPRQVSTRRSGAHLLRSCSELPKAAVPVADVSQALNGARRAG
ncbi:MAG TPA: hypothetical protein VGJ54_20780, partial [Streptosporangiaceae bacterium]